MRNKTKIKGSFELEVDAAEEQMNLGNVISFVEDLFVDGCTSSDFSFEKEKSNLKVKVDNIHVKLVKCVGNYAAVVVTNYRQDKGKQSNLEIFVGEKEVAKNIANRLAEVIGARVVEDILF